MRNSLLFYLITLLLWPVSRSNPIETLVVLMMENHSFDHFLGQLKDIRPDVDGSDASMCNPIDTSDDEQICVTHDGLFHTQEPENFIPDVNQQIYNIPFGTSPAPDASPNMKGFVANYVRYRGKDKAAEIMQGLNQSTLPVLYTLVQEYAISDRWFSSVPGSTFPNRNFLHAATAGGVVNNDIPPLGYPLTTTFEKLHAINVSYGIYSASPIPSTILYRYFRSPLRRPGTTMDQFYIDAEKGVLPSYTYIEPALFGVDQRLRNDQHPHAGSFYDIRRGELFYKQVYEALRASPQWNNLLFLLVWDEHGGFFDHVAPPTDVANPDGITDPSFDFTRLGIRVPAILISPWIPKGLLIPQTDIFEHSSVPSTLHELFGMDHLTARDRSARPFHTYANLSEPRTDCIKTLPNPAWQFDASYS
ncbi:phosphoesterase [Radiomyces spectabilis]|uniref:phosphoesterase n=1 Tax=Radiomyces spectabilis TaxID=64574 RepID=UPI0022211B63|nr:phosphoesterase [Radiomyces spectabilis]KAI8365959.1 phosphoesterase [Radiomyces spectabilis]